ncbi:MAG: hypothetical protein R3A46_09915 [Thermomicrobiales bacterium]
MNGRVLRVVIALSAILASLGGLATANAHGEIANIDFDGVWERTDLPVVEGQANRTWMWGPEPISQALSEPYWESPGGWRQVQYFDKSRMEISNPNGDSSSVWYVTNGLLAKELMTGEIPMSDSSIMLYTDPAEINVAGDADDPDGPTYATFNSLRNIKPQPDSQPITATVDRTGSVGDDNTLTSYSVTAAHHVEATNHSVASVFWDFMNSNGTVWDGSGYSTGKLFEDPFFATGLPLTEAYWTTVRVGGTPQQVLIQVFERRVLTYTPNNAPEWRVEAGNVGRHYYDWRYGTLQGLTMDYSAALTGGELPLKVCVDYTDVQTTANSWQLPGLRDYYGFDVAADISGRLCGVQQRDSYTYWYHLVGAADIYQGTTPSGEKLDTRAFQAFGYFVEPNNTIGNLPRPEECTAERYYAVAGIEDIWAAIARSSDPAHWEFWVFSMIDGVVNLAHWETYPCG